MDLQECYSYIFFGIQRMSPNAGDKIYMYIIHVYQTRTYILYISDFISKQLRTEALCEEDNCFPLLLICVPWLISTNAICPVDHYALSIYLNGSCLVLRTQYHRLLFLLSLHYFTFLFCPGFSIFLPIYFE